METGIEDLKHLVLNKVQDAENLLQQVQSHFTAVEGSKKLERRIRSEMKFLQKVNFAPKSSFLKCNNLISDGVVVGGQNRSKKGTHTVQQFRIFGCSG